MKRSSSGRTFGAQLLADPSAPRRWLRRFSLTGDGTLIACTLDDGLITLSVRGRTPRRTTPHLLVRVDGPPGSRQSRVTAMGSGDRNSNLRRYCKFYRLKMQRE